MCCSLMAQIALLLTIRLFIIRLCTAPVRTRDMEYAFSQHMAHIVRYVPMVHHNPIYEPTVT